MSAFWNTLWKALIAVLLMESFVLYLVSTKTPEVTLKADDHVSCNQSGFADGHGAVEVELQLGPIEHRILIVKTTAVSRSQAEAICDRWNDIGYELEK